ncbi:MAG: hypothetical protein P8R46_06560, partial [Planctomycetota bacterium]|nr:hypothetical protein [Planctomycetota bacterium]
MITILRQLLLLAATRTLILGAGLACGGLFGCAAHGNLDELGPGLHDPSRPYVVALGTAQDGGLPQIGCARECCTAAREDPARARLVTSLLLVDTRDGRRWLFDATPDIARQVERARGLGG